MDTNFPDSTEEPETVSPETSLEELSPPAVASVFFTSWKIYSATEAFKPRAPRKFVVQNLLPQPGLAMAFGRSGDQKSLLILDMCVCVAAGIPWLAPVHGNKFKSRKTLQSPVLWLDFDNGKDVMDERVEAAFRGHSLPRSTPFNYVTVPDEWLDISQTKPVQSLAQLGRAFSYKLIVIDNLGAVEGGVDENSSKMAQIMGRLRWAAQFIGATFVIIHHPHKDYGQNSNIGDLLRGHSSINAALDTSLLIERDSNDRTQLIIRGAKSRGSDIQTFGAKFTYTHRSSTEELYSTNFHGYVVEDKTSVTAARNKIIDLLTRNGAMNQNSIVNELRAQASRSRVFDLLEKMEAEGLLVISRGMHNSRVYGLRVHPVTDSRKMDLIRQLLTFTPESDE